MKVLFLYHKYFKTKPHVTSIFCKGLKTFETLESKKRLSININGTFFQKLFITFRKLFRLQVIPVMHEQYTDRQTNFLFFCQYIYHLIHKSRRTIKSHSSKTNFKQNLFNTNVKFLFIYVGIKLLFLHILIRISLGYL